MIQRYRIQLYWQGGAAEVAALGRSLQQLLTRIAAIQRQLAPWRREGEELRDEAVTTQALAAGKMEWALGRTTQLAYEARLHVGHLLAPTAELNITCGISQPPLAGLFAPNRVEILLSDASTEVVHQLLAAAAEIWAADFGHAGSERHPIPAAPLYSAGVPPVGWMTFFSRGHAPLPERLPEPAVAYPAAGGVIIVAHPAPYRDHDPTHREAVEAVAKQLGEAKVLRPSMALPD